MDARTTPQSPANNAVRTAGTAKLSPDANVDFSQPVPLLKGEWFSDAVVFDRELQWPRRTFGRDGNFDPELLALFEECGIAGVFGDVEIDWDGEAHLIAGSTGRSGDVLRFACALRFGHTDCDELAVFDAETGLEPYGVGGIDVEGSARGSAVDVARELRVLRGGQGAAATVNCELEAEVVSAHEERWIVGDSARPDARTRGALVEILERDSGDDRDLNGEQSDGGAGEFHRASFCDT
jgi:hypothetical protein